MPPQQLLATPLRRRRHSVTSLSTQSSPGSQPPLPKKQIIEVPSSRPMCQNPFLQRLFDQQPLRIKPSGWEYEEGEIWDDLYDSMWQTWEKNHSDILEKLFDQESWTDDFILLGFQAVVLDAFRRILSNLYLMFGREIVELVLSFESVGVIARLMLKGEVYYFSEKWLAVNEDGGEQSAQGDGKSQEASSSGDTSATSLPSGSRSLPSSLETPRSDRNNRDSEEPDKVPSATSEPVDHDSYPEWVFDLHNIAQSKGVQLFFTNDIENLPFPHLQIWDENLQGTTTPAYHGCDIPEDSMYYRIRSFLNSGVVSVGARRGYYSVGPATYYANSYEYAMVWPVIKKNLRDWTKLPTLPFPSTLIICSEPVLVDIQNDEQFSTVVIPQNETEKTRKVISSCSLSLTILQYVNATRDPRNLLRVPHPDFSGIESSDFIIAPLPSHTIQQMENSPIGRGMNHTISSITVLTAATDEAIRYMNSRITKVVILGWGEGFLGSNATVRFGTAGIKKGCTDYSRSFGVPAI